MPFLRIPRHKSYRLAPKRIEKAPPPRMYKLRKTLYDL